jgi:hypothetical protein
MPFSNYINKVAVELEGIYIKKSIESLLKKTTTNNITIKEDGSIHINKGIETTIYKNRRICEESSNIAFGTIDDNTLVKVVPLLTKELIPEEPYSDPEDLEKWIVKYYPAAVNETCGMHVHTSFKSIKHYNNLMEEEFYLFFLENMNKFIKTYEGFEQYPIDKERFKSRLNGENRFTTKVFIPDYQCKKFKGNYYRYTQLNFSYKVHNTIECRLFPMFIRVETALDAVKVLIKTYCDYLDKIYKNNEKKEKLLITKTIPLTGGSNVHSNSVR